MTVVDSCRHGYRHKYTGINVDVNMGRYTHRCRYRYRHGYTDINVDIDIGRYIHD